MNKKQRNRKNVTQNNRNKIKNRRYKSTIKTFFKAFIKKVNESSGTEINEILTKEIFLLKGKLHSFIDKAVKKNVIHKNNAARKKKRLEKLQKIKSE